MSVFKTKAVILNIDKNICVENIKKECFWAYTIFSHDFGKIRCIKKFIKKEKNLDIGHIINTEIKTSKEFGVNKMKNIKIINQFKIENKNFVTINGFLELLNLVIKRLPEGVNNNEVFELLETNILKEKLDEISIILSKLKLINILGELKIENEDKILGKILKFINENKIKNILKISGIDSNISKKLTLLI